MDSHANRVTVGVVSAIRHLLVDGANILHRWPDLSAMVKQDRSAARTLLTQRLMAIHDGGDVRITVVFDGRGPELTIERPAGEQPFSLIHTPAGTTADDVIEQLVANSAQPAECCVATEDNAERETIMASGATAMDAKSLAAWIERATSQRQQSMKNLRETNTKAWKRT